MQILKYRSTIYFRKEKSQLRDVFPKPRQPKASTRTSSRKSKKARKLPNMDMSFYKLKLSKNEFMTYLWTLSYGACIHAMAFHSKNYQHCNT